VDHYQGLSWSCVTVIDLDKAKKVIESARDPSVRRWRCTAVKTNHRNQHGIGTRFGTR